MTMPNFPRLPQRRFLWLLPIAILLAACSSGAGSDLPAVPTLNIPQPTATPTPLPRVAILFAFPDTDPQLLAETEQIVGGYASEQGLHLERPESLSSENLPESLEIIITLGSNEILSALAAAAPQARIIAINAAEQIEAPNLQQISLGGQAAEQAAFIAGYTAALSTDNWRIGLLHTPATAHLADAFITGMQFFCGSCIPVSPPYNDYPQSIQVENAQNWQPGADFLLGQSAATVYLAPELELPDIQQYFFNRNILLIGGTLSSPDISSGWLASIGSDPLDGLRHQLPLALAGLPLSQAPTSLTLTEVNGLYLSEARLRHINGVITDLLEGYIILP
jgi:hypothetical protein